MGAQLPGPGSLSRPADRYGGQRLDAACTRGLAFGDPCYRTTNQILKRGLDGHPVPQT